MERTIRTLKDMDKQLKIKVMTGLQNTLIELTNDELVKELEVLEEAERQDNLMDGSGDCGSIISKHYEPYYNAIQDELNERDIQICDTYESDMPY